MKENMISELMNIGFAVCLACTAAICKEITGFTLGRVMLDLSIGSILGTALYISIRHFLTRKETDKCNGT